MHVPFDHTLALQGAQRWRHTSSEGNCSLLGPRLHDLDTRLGGSSRLKPALISITRYHDRVEKVLQKAKILQC